MMQVYFVKWADIRGTDDDSTNVDKVQFYTMKSLAEAKSKELSAIVKQFNETKLAQFEIDYEGDIGIINTTTINDLIEQLNKILK
jgi:hypothetical protein